MSRVLETVLTGRNLLSPVLAQAARDVQAFDAKVASSQGKAAASAQTTAGAQTRAATTAATSTTAGATTQSVAAQKIAASNVKASTSAQASAATQVRAHTQAAESATVAARVQETANRSLATSNGMLGGSLTPLTAGLGALGLGLAYAGYRGMEFDAAMSQVQAASQASAADMGRLRESAITLGADTQYSAVEAAQGVTELSKAGVSTADILGGGLKGALNLAAAGQLEVADAAEIAATALVQFKLSGSQVPHVADLLAAGAGKAQGSVHDLGMALNQAGLVASGTGLSIEETTGSLAAFASAGLVGSDAGTSFRSMLQRLQNPSKESAEQMAELGLNMYGANGAFVGMEALAGQLQTSMAGLTQAQRDQAMAQIFGSDAVRAANVLYSQGEAGIRRWTKAVDDQGYASRQAAQLTDNLAGDLERAGGALDSFFTSAGSAVQGPLRELVQGFTGIVDVGNNVLGLFAALPGPVKVTIGALVALHLINGPLSGTLAAVGDHLSTMTTRAAGAATSMMTLRGAGSGIMAAFGGPWGLAIAAVGGLATALAMANPPLEVTEANVAKLNTAIQRLGNTGDVTGELARMFGDLDGVVADLNAVPPAISGVVDKVLYSSDIINAQGKIDLGQWLTYEGDRGGDFDRMQHDFKQAQQNVEDLDTTLATMVTSGQAEAAAAAVLRLRDAWVKSGGEVGEFQRKFPEVIAAMETYALTSDTVVDDTGQITNGLGEAKSAADLLRDAFDQLNGVALSNVEANIRWTQTLNDIKIAAENGNRSLDLNTKAGATNAEQFTEAARVAAEFAATVGDTQGVEAGRTKLGELRQALLDQAGAAGFDKEAIRNLIDTIFAVPENTDTAINLADNATPGIDAVDGALNAIDGKTSTVYVNTVTTETVNRILHAVPYQEAPASKNPIGFPAVPTRASGGPVWPGQTFLVGEEGPELVRFAAAGAVIPADATAAMLSARSGGSFAPAAAQEMRSGPSATAMAASAHPSLAAPAAMPGYDLRSPVAMPGYGAAVGGGGAPVVVKLSAEDLHGMALTGRLAMDPDGMVRLIDGRLDARQRSARINGRSV